MDGVLDISHHALYPVLLNLVQVPLSSHLVPDMMQSMVKLDRGDGGGPVCLQISTSDTAEHTRAVYTRLIRTADLVRRVGVG